MLGTAVDDQTNGGRRTAHGGGIQQELARIAERTLERRCREAALAADIASLAATSATEGPRRSGLGARVALQALQLPRDFASGLRRQEERMVCDVQLLGRSLEADLAEFEYEIELLAQDLGPSMRQQADDTTCSNLVDAGVQTESETANDGSAVPEVRPMTGTEDLRQLHPAQFVDELRAQLLQQHEEQQELLQFKLQHEQQQQMLKLQRQHQQEMDSLQRQHLHQQRLLGHLRQVQRQQQRRFCAARAVPSAGARDVIVEIWFAWARKAATQRQHRAAGQTVNVMTSNLRHSFCCEVVFHAWRTETSVLVADRKAAETSSAERLYQAWRGSAATSSAVLAETASKVSVAASSAASLGERVALALRAAATIVVPSSAPRPPLVPCTSVLMETDIGSCAATPSRPTRFQSPLKRTHAMVCDGAPSISASYAPLVEKLEEAKTALQLRDPRLAELVARLGTILLGELSSAADALRGAHELLSHMQHMQQSPLHGEMQNAPSSLLLFGGDWLQQKSTADDGRRLE